jgi:hypothetical protein
MRLGKRSGILIVFLLVVGIFLAVHPTFAQTEATSPGILDRIMLLIAGLAMALAAALGQVVVGLLNAIIIPLMQYNGFSTSPVVSAGWAIVRDTVNLFFVIVLIVIAFGTIFGWSRIEWRQQVPRLMIFALVINFSKTLCGLMIDIGQVIMLTFANALADIAGGNFIQLFGLQDIISLSLESPTFANLTDPAAQGPQSFDYMASGVGALAMMTIVLSTVIVLASVLAWRIVMLWVLVTISPIAWFMGGARGVFESDAYKEWWNNFKCYVAIGPIITFFLWLTLAVAGSGNIAASAGFNSALDAVDTSSVANVSGSLLKIFETSRLVSFIIGIAMLYAGFNAATKVCQAASQGGFVTDRFREGAQPKAIASAIGLTAAAGARRIGREGAGLAARGTRAATGGRVDLTTTGRADMYRRIAQNAPTPGIARVAGGWAEQLEKQRAAEVTAAGAPVTELGNEAKLDYLRSVARSGTPRTETGRMQAQAAFASILGDAKLRNKLGEDNMQTLFKSIGHEMEASVKGDSTLHHNVEEFEKARPDIAFKGDEKKIADKISDMDDVRKLDKAAMADPAVRARLKALSSGYADEKGNELTAYDWISKGRLGIEKQEMLAPPKTVEAIVDYDPKAEIPPVLSPSNSRQLSDVISKDATELGKINPAQLRANAGNNEVTRAAVEGLSPVGLQKMFRKYAEGDSKTRAELDKAIDNAAFLAEQGSVSAANTKPYENMKKYISSTRERMAAIPPKRSVVEIDEVRNPLVAKQAGDQESLRKLNSGLETARKNKLASEATIAQQVNDLNQVIASQQEQIAKLDQEREIAARREFDEKASTVTQAKIS